ncbi:ribokinase [Halalkaliarchaeum desulfuricum]|uniref:Ribokinase n=1 Tax=Halalkaliarchaeum desulfuricum TaxID=2055893 RepID=A0A343THQ8_9EURY|nr:PfkB family carbohydrate kinase [Halalkaliarchaeum desulfuricum]AUX08630.1 ribokinase [Halalkaliarchaeum desulfuricum]
MTDTKPNVICAGHINWDVTMHVDKLPEPDGEVQIRELIQSGGGSAANVAVGLSGLDADATVFGSVGGDDSGAFALQELDRSGVQCGHVLVAKDETTAVKYLVVDDDGEVMVFASDGANEAFSAGDLPPRVVATADHLHLTSQRPETAVELAALVRDVGGTVSFDPGRRVGQRAFKRAFPHVDVLFCNRREAELAAEDYRENGPDDGLLVTKRGADGATVSAPKGTVSHPGFEIDAVDTTGSGDAFAAGFLAAWLGSRTFRRRFRRDGGAAGPDVGSDGSDDPPLEEVLAVANACGALTAMEATARTDLTWDRVASLVEKTEE